MNSFRCYAIIDKIRVICEKILGIAPKMIWSVFVKMKIRHTMISALVLSVLLTACAPEKAPSETTALTTEPTSVETAEVTETQAPVIGDLIPVPLGGIGEKSEQYEVTKWGVTVLSVSLTLPEANITGNDSLQTALTERLDANEEEIRSYVDSLAAKYEDDLISGKTGLATPSVQIRFELNYFTADAISLTFFYNETTSEGRTAAYARFCNIDLRAGSEIRLSALLNEGGADQLATKIKEAVEASGSEGLYAGQKDLITDLLEERWYMTRQTLEFRFSPGDLAPVSSGEITVSLDKAALADLLNSYGSALIEEKA